MEVENEIVDAKKCDRFVMAFNENGMIEIRIYLEIFLDFWEINFSKY